MLPERAPLTAFLGLVAFVALACGMAPSASAAAGDLDPSFSGNGLLTETFPVAPDAPDGADAVAVQSDEKILAVGRSLSPQGRFALARYNPDGSLDTTFSGDGEATTVFPFHYGAEARAVALQRDGKIVVAGEYDFHLALARYNAHGSRDETFGDRGMLIKNGLEGARAVAVQPDNKIVVASDYGIDFELARFKPNGTLDTGFGSGGRVRTDLSGVDSSTAVALQPNGKILVAGSSDTNYPMSDFALARYRRGGSLDEAFGYGGTARTDLGGYDRPYAMALQPDGKIVTAGIAGSSGFGIARYNRDGSPDPSFGANGVVTTEFGSVAGANAVAVQADGKILAAGFGSNTGGGFAIARYRQDGSLDQSFSDDGTQLTDLAGTDVARGLAVQSDGGIVVAGSAGDPEDFALVRYDTTGSLDQSFSGDGVVTTNVGYAKAPGEAMALQSDGAVVVAGGDVLARYRRDGSPDESFGSDGHTYVHRAYYPGSGLALQSNGGIVLQQFDLIARYMPSGRPDRGFGNEGEVDPDFYGFSWFEDVATQSTGQILAIEAYTDDHTGGDYYFVARLDPHGSYDYSFGPNKARIGFYGHAIEVQSDDKIVVAGETYDRNFAVARYNADGSLDQGFGRLGMVSTSLGGYDSANAIALQPDGVIVVAGVSVHDSRRRIGLARYRPDGSLDKTFGSDGTVLTSVRRHCSTGDLAVQENGAIVVAGSAGRGAGTDFAIIRYRPDGSLDHRFGTGGKLTTDLGGKDRAAAVAFPDDGGIIAAGSVNDGSAQSFALARYKGGRSAAGKLRITSRRADLRG